MLSQRSITSIRSRSSRISSQRISGAASGGIGRVLQCLP